MRLKVREKLDELTTALYSHLSHNAHLSAAFLWLLTRVVKENLSKMPDDVGSVGMLRDGTDDSRTCRCCKSSGKPSRHFEARLFIGPLQRYVHGRSWRQRWAICRSG
jgi:hypothetical protein